MKNIHVIPTDKPSKGYILGKCIKRLLDVKIGQFTITHYLMFDEEYFQAHNIYITSDEENKEGDWVIDEDYDKSLVYKADRIFFEIGKDAKKIILTTDPELIKDGVQAIDDEFLQWFINNSTCEWVEVLKDKCLDTSLMCDCVDEPCRNKGYKIIIPKLKPNKNFIKSETEFLGIEFTLKDGSKQFVPKQETIEEVAERIYQEDFNNPYLEEVRRQDIKNAMIKLAKWQQERMYSEEEVLSILRGFELTYDGKASESKLQKWFERYKKK